MCEILGHECYHHWLEAFSSTAIGIHCINDSIERHTQITVRRITEVWCLTPEAFYYCNVE